MTGMIVSLLIGLTIGALGAIAFTCCTFSEEIARKEELEQLLESSIPMSELVKILRSELISAKRKDRAADSWRNSRMKVLKIEGTYFLVQNGELLDSFDDKESADLALFDRTRGWESYHDRDRRRPE